MYFGVGSEAGGEHGGAVGTHSGRCTHSLCSRLLLPSEPDPTPRVKVLFILAHTSPVSEFLKFLSILLIFSHPLADVISRIAVGYISF